MLYLLDANVLITANNTYYPIDTVPEYWEWVGHQATARALKIPVEIYGNLEQYSLSAISVLAERAVAALVPR
jgi:hypothetical protein